MIGLEELLPLIEYYRDKEPNIWEVVCGSLGEMCDNITGDTALYILNKLAGSAGLRVGYQFTLEELAENASASIWDCRYCGEPADTRDHILPVTVTGKSARKFVPTVPACNHCNTTLGALYLPSVRQRRAYLFDQFQTKYRRLLKIPPWATAELGELGPKLRRQVVADINRQKVAKRRIRTLYYHLYPDATESKFD